MVSESYCSLVELVVVLDVDGFGIQEPAGARAGLVRHLQPPFTFMPEGCAVPCSSRKAACCTAAVATALQTSTLSEISVSACRIELQVAVEADQVGFDHGLQFVGSQLPARVLWFLSRDFDVERVARQFKPAAGSFRSRTMVFFSFPKPWPGSKAGHKTIKPMIGNLRISRPSILRKSYHDRTLGYLLWRRHSCLPGPAGAPDSSGRALGTRAAAAHQLAALGPSRYQVDFVSIIITVNHIRSIIVDVKKPQVETPRPFRCPWRALSESSARHPRCAAAGGASRKRSWRTRASRSAARP